MTTHTLRMNLITDTKPTAEALQFSPNFLNHMFAAYGPDGVLDNDERRHLTTVTCNALTNQMMWALIAHCNSIKRSEIQHLDERNEQDEHARGQPLSDHLTDASGFEVRSTPLHIASVCDGIRFSLYEDLHAFLELPEAEDALYRTPNLAPDHPARYTAPMSLEALLNFWTERRGEVAPDDAERLRIVQSKFPEQHARMLEEVRTRARREQAKFKELAIEVLTEAKSLNDAFDIDAFTTLPLDVQLQIAERIQTKLLERAAKAMANTRVPLETALSESVVVESLSNHAKAWLNQPKIQHARGVFAQVKEAKRRGLKPTTLKPIADDGDMPA